MRDSPPRRRCNENEAAGPKFFRVDGQILAPSRA
jgi:hypothetical protein